MLSSVRTGVGAEDPSSPTAAAASVRDRASASRLAAEKELAHALEREERAAARASAAASKAASASAEASQKGAIAVSERALAAAARAVLEAEVLSQEAAARADELDTAMGVRADAERVVAERLAEERTAEEALATVRAQREVAAQVAAAARAAEAAPVAESGGDADAAPAPDVASVPRPERLHVPEGDGPTPVAAAESAATASPSSVPRVAGHRLQPGDQIDLQIYREPGLSGVLRVDANGEVRHALIGSFRVLDMTAAEAETALTQLLSEKYLVNPRVTVSVVSAQGSNVVLLGEVKTPGVHPVPFGESITLLQAIARAGGFTGLASVDRVTVIRTVDGKEQSIRVRVSRLISGTEPDLPLLPNDVIMVPQVLF